MADEQWADERIVQLLDNLQVTPENLPAPLTVGEARVILLDWKAALAEIERLLDHIATLNGLLDRAFDGLDEYWVTLPENKATVDRIAEMFGRKPKGDSK